MSRTRIALYGLLALVLAFQAGCGFRLRGSLEIPADYNPMLIQAPAGSAVERAMRDLHKAFGLNKPAARLLVKKGGRHAKKTR